MSSAKKFAFGCVRRLKVSLHTKRQLRASSSSAPRCGLSSHMDPVVFNHNENRKRTRQLRSLSSVSKSEVSKFSEFSEIWWDPQQNPLIGMNSIRVGYIVDEIKQSSTAGEQTSALSGLKALDVGCGGGLLSESLARLGADVVAVDPSETLVEHAKRHAELDPRTRSIDYRGGYTIEQLAEETSEPCFDVICILEVVEHVTDVESILRAAKSLLKPDTGRLFVSTINRTLKSGAIAIVGAEYIMGYLPPGTHDWNQFFSPEEVAEIMNRVGLQQIDVQGMVVTKPPFQGRWDWKLDRQDTDVNWIGAYKSV